MRPAGPAVLAALLAQAALAQAPPLPAASPPPAAGPAWQPRAWVDLVGLDKVSGRATPFSGAVGQTLHFGTLSVRAQACLVRPPEAAADAAAFLAIADERSDTTPFAAWMLLSAPAASIYEHPVYDIRLVGCHGL